MIILDVCKMKNKLLHSDAFAMQGVYFAGVHWKRKRVHFLTVLDI